MMHGMYTEFDPAVINDQMLAIAVEEQGPKEAAGVIAKMEGIEFKDVTALRLDFKNILTIDGLFEFVNLTKLQLDNNIIEKIEGIEMCIHLVWLDLSFNNIEVIENLDTLTKLEDLSLQNNQITWIENMDTLENLQFFSIGHNCLEKLETVAYLEKHLNLRSLNLSQNPLCEEENYKSYVIGHLPQLLFLDYHIVDDQFRETAYHALHEDDISGEDLRLEALKEEEQKKKEQLELNKKAFVLDLDTPKLFESMFENDPDGKNLRRMPEMPAIFTAFQEKFTAICFRIYTVGLESYNIRQHEEAQFLKLVKDAKAENKKTCQEAIATFMSEKQAFMDKLSLIYDPGMVRLEIEGFSSVITTLWDTLMGYEMNLVDQLEDSLQAFELEMQELVSEFVEEIQAYMARLRETEHTYNERLIEVTHTMLDKVAKLDSDPEVSDTIADMLLDKDTAMSAITTSRDIHLLKIDDAEDHILTSVHAYLKAFVENFHVEEQHDRNRHRVMEINNLIDYYREEIESYEIPEM